MHLWLVHHILWQQVPQFTWLWVKKPHPLKDIYFPVKNSGIFLIWKPFHSMDPLCCPFPLPFFNYCRHVLHTFRFTSGTITFHSIPFKSRPSRLTFRYMILISSQILPPSFPAKPYLCSWRMGHQQSSTSFLLFAQRHWDTTYSVLNDTLLLPANKRCINTGYSKHDGFTLHSIWENTAGICLLQKHFCSWSITGTEL